MKKAVCIILGTLSVFLFSGCSGNKDGALIVGTEATFPPFEMTNDKGEIVGFDIDLLNAVAKEAGLVVRFQDAGFDSLIPALQSGSIDIVASGMSITEERKKQILYSDPYIEAGLVIAVDSKNTTIHSVADMKGKIIAVQQGSTGASEAERMRAAGAIKQVKNYPNVSVAMMELLNGGAAAVINDKPVTEAYMAKRPGVIRVLDEELQSDSYGFAVDKRNPELVEKLNQGLAVVIENGTYDELIKKYFSGQE
jgi:ABC-type amino acid transport substrate-binding protein